MVLTQLGLSGNTDSKSPDCWGWGQSGEAVCVGTDLSVSHVCLSLLWGDDGSSLVELGGVGG